MFKADSAEQERRIAKRLHSIFGRGRTQPGSGNKDHSPNDVAVTNELHVECKTTAGTQIVLQWQWIENARRKALSFGVPAFLAFSFRKSRDYFIVDDETFYSLLQTQRDHEHLLNKIREKARVK